MKNTKIEKGFRKLLVSQRAPERVLLIYKLTEKFPKHEIFGLTSQMRRAGVSVAANMAEGDAARGTGQFGRHLAETGYLIHRLIKSLGRK